MIFTLEPMVQAVRYFCSQHAQDSCCDACIFIPFKKLEDVAEIPEGYEEMRDIPAVVKLCAEHNVPRYPWLVRADETRAAEWLQAEAQKLNGPLAVNAKLFGRWKAALEASDGTVCVGCPEDSVLSST